MKLEGRNLSLRMQGEDVERLKEELRKLGFSIERDEAGFGKTTRQAVLEFQRKRGLGATGVVDESTANLINAEVDALKPEPEPRRAREPFFIRGQVRRADGVPFVGGVVRAFDKDLRAEEDLSPPAGVTIDQTGHYEIQYTAEQFRRADKKSADLIVRVFGHNGDTSPLASSAVMFNASPVATVNLVIGDGRLRGPSEYEQLLAEITPLLPQGLSLADLTEDERHQDITFLTGETGQDRQRITFLVLAHQMARRDLPPEVFYGLFRQGLPTTLSALLAVNSRAQRRALEKSLRDNIVPAVLSADLVRILESLQELFVTRALEPRGADQGFSLGDLLGTSTLTREMQQKFVSLYRRRNGSIKEFWEALGKDPDFSRDGRVDELQFTLQLGLLTGNNVPLVEALQGLRQQGALRAPRDLARLDIADWQGLIDKAGDRAVESIPPRITGETREEKIANYINGIVETLKITFPTAFVSLGIARAPAIDVALVKQLLTRNPDLDPSEPLPREINWGGTSAADQMKARASLEAMRQEIKMFPALDYQQALGDGQTPSSFSNPIRTGVDRFLANEPDFDFADTHIDTYLAEHAATAFNGIAELDRPAVTAQLKSLQRVFRVAPRYEHMEALMGEGLDSAYAIASIPETALAQLFNDKFGDDTQAIAYYSKAQHITVTNTTSFTSISQSLNDVMPYVIGGPSDKLKKAMKEALKQRPSWTTLFDRIDLCDCEHCRSVYSPAAYLVDLLHFLDPKVWKSPEPGQQRPIDVLLERRPDLQHIKLTCQNTNTPLPYIDLVNEILEFYVAHDSLNGLKVPRNARNTEGITAAELSVNPQYRIDAAYDKLAASVYPFTLPFNRPLEVARAYLEHLGSSRHQVMNTFQHSGLPSDLAIACENLKLSKKEREILTGAMPPPQEPFVALHQFYGYINPVGWQDDVARVTEFLKRTGSSYVDLIELLKTRFLNANKSITLVPIVPDSNEPTDLCDLSNIKINNLDATALNKMQRFIRLWRKLGWEIRDVDKAMAALQADDIDETVLQDLAKVKRLQEELKLPLIPLLSLWANIDTYGEDALYPKLFQSRAVLNPVDSAFALNDDGSNLSNTSHAISDHAPAILAALRLNENDLALLREATGLSDATAPLTLANLSRLYRHALLAKALKLKVKDLIALMALMGIAPTKPGAPEETVTFVERARRVKSSGFTVAQLNYLYRHVFEPGSGTVPSPDRLALLCKQLHDGLRAIEDDNVLAPDPTGELTRKKLETMWEGAVVVQFVAMIDGSAIYRTKLSTLPALTVPSLASGRVYYDSASQELRFVAAMNEGEKDLLLSLSEDIHYLNAVDKLSKIAEDGQTRAVTLENLPLLTLTRTGQKIAYDNQTESLRFVSPMTQAERDILLSLANDAEYQAAIDDLFQQPRTFLLNTKAGFLNLADATAQLLDTVSLTAENKFGYILQRLLPYLRDSLSRSLVKQTLGDELKLESAMIELLLETILKSPTHTGQLMMEDFPALLESGLFATYCSDPQMATPFLSRLDAVIAFDGKAITGALTIPPGTGSARWTGKLLAPNNGDFIFYVRASGGVRLWIGDDSQPILDVLQNQSNDELASISLTLKASQLYSLRLEVFQLQDPAIVELRWSSPSTPKDIIPHSNLYPSDVYDAFVAAFVRLSKAALLITTLKLTDREVAYLSSHGNDFAGSDPVNAESAPFDLNTLPLDSSDFEVAFFSQWERLVDLFTLRDSLPQRDVRLIDVFEAATADGASLSDVRVKIVESTGWDDTELGHLIEGFGLTAPEFKNEMWLLRLQACLKLSKRLGVSAQHLFPWATVEPNADQARDIVKTVKAKYEDDQWLAVGKPLNDGLREQQKAALIAHVLTEKNIIDQGITDSNQLFEWFLIDVDMSACMMTSRIKQAISSVQLFIQRCLMNLEQREGKPESSVSPRAIDIERWEWMKNYRVWEANRKVFLYPENWIEPELRDDKSPFFKELESQLLQNEVTNETVEQAILDYLYKLDEVAQLQPCAMYWQKAESRDATEMFHVFGRTLNSPPRYFYRRLVVKDGIWTPWEKVDLDIEGDGHEIHLIPLVYNRRLYLFWPVFTRKPDPYQPKPIPEGSEPKEIWEIKMAWSEYHQNRWSSKIVSADFLPHPTIRVASPSGEVPIWSAGPVGQSEFTFSVNFPADVLNINAHVTDPKPLESTNMPYAGSGVVGIFWMDSCGSTMRTFVPPPEEPISAFYEKPDSSVMEYQIFEQVVTQKEESDEEPNDLTLPTDTVSGRQRILKTTPSPYRVLHPHQLNNGLSHFSHGSLVALSSFYPFLYQDRQRTYFASPDSVLTSSAIELNLVNVTSITGRHDLSLAAQPATQPPKATNSLGTELTTIEVGEMPKTSSLVASYRFATFFHPHICTLIKAFAAKGVPGLLTLSNQRLNNDLIIGDRSKVFEREYVPNIDWVHPDHPTEDVDFRHSGAYSVYNWELFFHAPMLIATRLSQEQRFAEAQAWFHYIFNPTDNSGGDSPQRYWKVLPFFKNAHPEEQQIQQLLEALSYTGNDEQKNSNKKEVEQQVEAWRDNPFNPHLIARMRITAYQKNVVMKYIENLIAWGDQLFSRDTIESINEATQLYVLAANMLGARPEHIPPAGTLKPETYALLRMRLDSFSNVIVQMETEFPLSTGDSSSNGGRRGGRRAADTLNLGSTFYFCIPNNDKLLSYWDTVADRLFKIRHCMNIEGVVRQLPLFEPPIDPALLVRAFAMGVDISSVLNDINAPTPHYRFNYMLQKALELCAELKSLGGALLSALEKKDAEELSTTRASHEMTILKAVREVRKQQIKEAKTTREGLEKTEEVIMVRQAFYKSLIEEEGRNRIGPEKNQVDELNKAQKEQSRAHDEEETASDITTYTPDVTTGVSGGSPPTHSTVSLGRGNIIAYYQARSRAKAFKASEHTHNANLASIKGVWQRRDDEWKLQFDLATKELEQIKKQIAAAEIRETISQMELDNHEKQIENATQIEEFLRSKYTNQELYTWMVGEVSKIYFQSYKLAYDIAKRAERAYRFELGLTDSNFIQFGYWDSLRKGLLTGERLYLDLKRMEMAYIEKNKREYEITKHISLMLHAPLALIALKETGRCEVFLPEAMFDADYPGHYMRRVKSVSLTIPCVVGPYTSINCTLTLLSNKTRIKSVPADPYSENEDGEDNRFVNNFAALQSITTSHAQNDSGVFELNFRDERYLPFEGAGAISRWRIDMPQDCNAFDFKTLSDVVLHLKYTAREGGEILRKAAKDAVQKAIEDTENDTLARMFTLKHEFPSEWHRFLSIAETTTGDHVQKFAVTQERFPFYLRGKDILINKVHLFAVPKNAPLEAPLTINLTPPDTPPDDANDQFTLEVDPTLGGILHQQKSFEIALGEWTLKVKSDDFAAAANAIDDIWIVCEYSTATKTE